MGASGAIYKNTSEGVDLAHKYKQLNDLRLCINLQPLTFGTINFIVHLVAAANEKTKTEPQATFSFSFGWLNPHAWPVKFKVVLNKFDFVYVIILNPISFWHINYNHDLALFVFTLKAGAHCLFAYLFICLIANLNFRYVEASNKRRCRLFEKVSLFSFSFEGLSYLPANYVCGSCRIGA